MKITKTSLDAIQQAFNHTKETAKSLELVDFQQLTKTSFRFRLKVKTGSPESRVSASGRRGPWASWETYRIFLEKLFDLCPNCTAYTALETYKGKDSFYELFPATYYKKVGNRFSPAYFGEL